MRSGDLPAYLSLNRLLNGTVSCSRCYFVQIRPISQKFNSCVTHQPTDGRTNLLIEFRDARTHLKITKRWWRTDGVLSTEALLSLGVAVGSSSDFSRLWLRWCLFFFDFFLWDWWSDLCFFFFAFTPSDESDFEDPWSESRMEKGRSDNKNDISSGLCDGSTVKPRYSAFHRTEQNLALNQGLFYY